jgi:DNA (cytosine-5)-methyltransferase 1
VKAGTPRTSKVYAVDLFCGAGGLTKGLLQAGIDVKLGVDVDPTCEYPYTANNGVTFLCRSVDGLQADEVEAYLPNGGIRLLAGCAPCQTFSKYNRKASATDQRWWLIRHFSRLILQIRPELVTMENVPEITERGVFRSFLADLTRARYHIGHGVVACCQYGVPQWRSRLVLLASSLGPIRMLTPGEIGSRPCTVRDAIKHLPPIRAGGVCESDRMHQSSRLSPINLRRMQASRPGRTWRDWEEAIVAECHKRATGRTYPSVYGRMTWDEPAPTVTTQFYGFGNGRFGHPEQDRAISLREGAILQGFPDDYAFVRKTEPIRKKTVGRLIGNAVPVQLGRAIGKTILDHVAKVEASLCA